MQSSASTYLPFVCLPWLPISIDSWLYHPASAVPRGGAPYRYRWTSSAARQPQRAYQSTPIRIRLSEYAYQSVATAMKAKPVPATAQNECAWAHLLVECTPLFPRGRPVRERPTTTSHSYHRRHIAVPSILRPSAYLSLLISSSRTCHSPRNLRRRRTPSRTRSFTARSSSPPRPPKTRHPGRKSLHAAIWMTH
jgi:hypothetical protein